MDYPRVAERVVKITQSAAMAGPCSLVVDAARNMQFGAWREGTHDDLVLSVALACWGARKLYPSGPYREEWYWPLTGQQEWLVGVRKWARGRLV